ncbi:hypothetical protein EAE96_007655 [Botrytis aclada]|nr:hypothetical protein EAE96_007655 [Botrytis aclada]
MISVKSQLVLFRKNPFRNHHHLAVSRPDPLDALKNSPLREVSNELLKLIAKHLTPASAASFSLSCRQIGLVIGTQYIDRLKTSKDDKVEFLSLLEHDLQDQVFCSLCGELHSIRNAKRYAKKSYCWDRYSTIPQASRLPAAFDTIPNCLKEDESLLAEFYMYKNFGSTIFKMAMKNCRLFGNDARTRQLLRLLSEPMNRSVHMIYKSLSTEKKGECRMKNGSLFTRKVVNSSWDCQSFDAPSYILICPHLNLEKDGSKFRARLNCPHKKPEILWSASQPHCQKNTGTNENNASQDVQSGLLQCWYCLTVCKFKLKHHKRFAISCCTTKLAFVVYKQFESEEDWETHVEHYDSDEKDGEESIPIEFSKEKISSVFEVDDTGFETRFTFWTELYFAWQKAFSG